MYRFALNGTKWHQNIPFRSQTALKTGTLFGGKTLMIGTVVEIRLVQKKKNQLGTFKNHQRFYSVLIKFS